MWNEIDLAQQGCGSEMSDDISQNYWKQFVWWMILKWGGAGGYLVAWLELRPTPRCFSTKCREGELQPADEQLLTPHPPYTQPILSQYHKRNHQGRPICDSVMFDNKAYSIL